MQYWIMDGRANYSISSATILSTCDTLEEANDDLLLFGTGSCLVEVKDGRQEVIDSLSWLECPSCGSAYVKRLKNDNLECEGCRCKYKRSSLT